MFNRKSTAEIMEEQEMKKYSYEIHFVNGEKRVEEITADSVMDGHYEIYRRYGRTYKKSTYLKK